MISKLHATMLDAKVVLLRNYSSSLKLDRGNSLEDVRNWTDRMKDIDSHK